MALPKLMLAAGAVTLAAALVWWWSTFGDVVQYGYLSWSEAGRCLVRDSDICALAKVLCLGSHPRSVDRLLDERLLARPRRPLAQPA